MSTSLQEDFNSANTIFNNYFSCSSHIYGNTNEELDDIFNSINISNKSVLAVMSSGDYLIMSYLFGAKSVECFDINPLTYRYFFLRKWLIQNGVLEYGKCGYERLIEIVNSVSNFSSEYERESNTFWKEIIERFSKFSWDNNKLITSDEYTLCSYFYDKKRKEIERLVPSLNPVFYNVSLSEESGLGTNKKYDYVFISNILDWSNNRSPRRLEIIKRNLLNILNSDGRVVCTHFPSMYGGRNNSPEIIKLERQVFDNDFNFQMFDDRELVEGNIAYMYTRKN